MPSFLPPDMSRSGYRFSGIIGDDGSPKPKAAVVKDASSSGLLFSGSQMSLSTSIHGSSGYSADSERTGFSGEPPMSIDLFSRSQKKHTAAKPGEDGPTKRCRIEETNYLAATAKLELVRQGLKIPEVRKASPRLIPRDLNIDMTHVDHVYSTSDDPSIIFRGPENFAIAATGLSSESFMYVDESLPLLLKSCQSFYREKKGDPTPKDTINSESSTSSVTSDPEGSGESSQEEELVPIFSSIGDALSLSKEARIVTLSEEPFMVVHVNAAFSRMTGLPSIRIQGKELRDLIEGESLLQALSSAFPTLTTSTIRFKRSKTSTWGANSKKNSQSYKVIISPVGAPDESPTHLVIGLTNCRGS